MMTDGRKTAGALGSAGAGVGAALTATVASACCVGPVAAPLIVGILGAGGAAWAASLKPYSPYLLAFSGALLAYAFWALYRPGASCDTDEPKAPEAGRWTRWTALAVAWSAAALWSGAVVLNLTIS